MNILIATGIYPPSIGGIATYAKQLGEELRQFEHEVSIVTYGKDPNRSNPQCSHPPHVTVLSKGGGILARWLRYAKVLKSKGRDADVVIALSSVSVGVPLILARLRKPKKVIRLGGEFFWERYTDAGGMRGLRQWHESRSGFWRIIDQFIMPMILQCFDRIVYSTEFQRAMHQKRYPWLKKTAVIENALPIADVVDPGQDGSGIPIRRAAACRTDRCLTCNNQKEFRLLCMSRFVGFKNLAALIDAMHELPNVRLTIVGEGPLEGALKARAAALLAEDRIRFLKPVHGTEKEVLVQSHDLLIVPSITEISPNTALEARAAGLPVLLTYETGLSPKLTQGMVLRLLRTPEEIANGVREVMHDYTKIVAESSTLYLDRPWKRVAEEWMRLLMEK